MKIFIDVCFYLISALCLIMAVAGLCTKEFGMFVFFGILGASLIPVLRNKINTKATEFINNNMFKDKEPKPVLVKFLIGLFKFVFFLFLLVACACAMSDNTTTSTNAPAKAPAEVKTTKSNKPQKSNFRNNKNAKLIAKTTGLHKDLAGKAYEQLVSCGVGNITEIELFNKNEDYATSYYIKAYGIPAKIVVYIDDNGNIPEMYYNMNTIIKDRKRIATIQDYSLTLSQWSDLRYRTEETVRKFLKAPSTAKFLSIDYFVTEDKIIHVSGKVEAKNSFGVPLETIFQAEYRRNGDSFETLKFELDGQKIW